jgi:hypothetical protein
MFKSRKSDKLSKIQFIKFFSRIIYKRAKKKGSGTKSGSGWVTVRQNRIICYNQCVF